MDTTTSLFAFLPWLRLKKPHIIAGVEFVPMRDDAGVTAPVLVGSIDPLTKVLSGYIDRKGEPIDNCVVATIPGRGWNLRDDDFETVEWASSLLFLATLASNDYFPRWGGPYVNSTSFRVVWQRFSGVPTYIALTSRRRDGRHWDGGYKHGEVKFSLPLQCSLREPVRVDETFLNALDQGNALSCKTIRQLHYALPFLGLANTDDDLITEVAEAILMGSAFEQLLQSDASAYKLARKFGVLFGSCGNVTVEVAKKARPGIEIDASTPERVAAQPKWWVHRKWMEELYDLRSKSVHEGTAGGRSWGWTPFEHLIMAAWAFPIAVKLLLQRDGHYSFSEDDTCRCLAVDKLLAATAWGEEIEGGTGPHRWHEIVSSTAEDYKFDKTIQGLLQQHPNLFGGSTADDDRSQGSA